MAGYLGTPAAARMDTDVDAALRRRTVSNSSPMLDVCPSQVTQLLAIQLISMGAKILTTF